MMALACIGAKASSHVVTAQPVVKFTCEDYRTAPPERRYELLDGDLIMVPAPNLKRQEVQGRLYYKLTQFIVERALESCSSPRAT